MLIKRWIYVDGGLKKTLEQSQNGDMIPLYNGYWDTWSVCLAGVVTQSNGYSESFLLNGSSMIGPHGRISKWHVLPAGTLFFTKEGEPNSYYKDGILFHQGSYPQWGVCNRGLIVKSGDTLYLQHSSCREVLYEGEIKEWAFCFRGVIVYDGETFFLNQQRLCCHPEYDSWQPYSDGVAIQHGNKFYVNSETMKGIASIVNGCKRWQPHPTKGIVVDQGNKLLIMKNGDPKVVYQGRYDGWKPHPDGVVVREENRFTLVVHS